MFQRHTGKGAVDVLADADAQPHPAVAAARPSPLLQLLSHARLHDVQRLPVPGAGARRRYRLLAVCLEAKQCGRSE